MVGATPVQLRTWEQQNLIAPGRTSSGYRLYTITDIERMRRIQSLMAAGVNAAGVRRILDSAASPTAGRAAAAPADASHSPRTCWAALVVDEVVEDHPRILHDATVALKKAHGVARHHYGVIGLTDAELESEIAAR